MSEATYWFGVTLLVLAMILTALQLDAAAEQSSEHDNLRAEIATLRAEVRCFAE